MHERLCAETKDDPKDSFRFAVAYVKQRMQNEK